MFKVKRIPDVPEKQKKMKNPVKVFTFRWRVIRETVTFSISNSFQTILIKMKSRLSESPHKELR